MCHNLFDPEAFVVNVHKVVLVTKKDLSFDAPMVVDEVWVVEIYAPPLSLWRKTS